MNERFKEEMQKKVLDAHSQKNENFLFASIYISRWCAMNGASAQRRRGVKYIRPIKLNRIETFIFISFWNVLKRERAQILAFSRARSNINKIQM